MAVGIIFEYGPDHIFVRVHGNAITFSSHQQQKGGASLQDLKLNKEGVIKEFPDLKDSPLWREEAIYRFKEKIKSLKTEHSKIQYIIGELKPHGYKVIATQKDGFRPVKISG